RSRSNLLLGAPARLTRETLTGASDVAQSRRELLKLEQELETPRSVVSAPVNRSRLRVAYLRSTPGPGTQAGGAASHIKGVVEALEALGVEVQIISNDLIAGMNHSEERFTVIPPEPGGGTRAQFDI